MGCESRVEKERVENSDKVTNMLGDDSFAPNPFSSAL